MQAGLEKYAAVDVPRYTSYPTAAQFGDEIGEADYRGWLKQIGPSQSLSLYVHVPFCHRLCYYCGCHTTIVHAYDRVGGYVPLLDLEIEALAAALPKHAGTAHIHFGGGTPTILRPEHFTDLMALIRERFQPRVDAEISVEIDPRSIDEARIAALAGAGVTRVSLGVQVFSKRVQDRINRIQPFELVAEAVSRLRAAGITRINFDLMYGLPGQSVEDVRQSVDLSVSLAPDRFAVFGYAHVPWFKKHQNVFTDNELPGLHERFAQAEMAASRLRTHGFVEIGFDHYARPDDPMATAYKAGTLRRNFQGYTTDAADVLLGIGASSIGALAQGHVQNAPGLGTYRDLVNAGRLPVVCGIALGGEDILRRAVIEQIMCGLAADVGEICALHGFPLGRLDAAIGDLIPLEQDGLLELDGRRLQVTARGRRFLRNITACFDAYRTPSPTRYSRAV